MGLETAILGGASALSGLMSSNASSKAADAQIGYYQDALALQEQQYNDSMEMIEPFYDASTMAIEPYLNSLGIYKVDPGMSVQYVEDPEGGEGQGEFLGLNIDRTFNEFSPYQDGGNKVEGDGLIDSIQKGFGSYADAPSGYYAVGDQQFDTEEEAQAYLDSQSWENRGFQESPGYQYNFDQMTRAVDRSASAGGRSLSGETLKELQYNAEGLASQEYSAYQNALAGLMGLGTTTTSQAMGAGQNYANSATNLYSGMGQAKASGYEGQASAWNNALGNMSTAYMYDKMGMFG